MSGLYDGWSCRVLMLCRSAAVVPPVSAVLLAAVLSSCLVLHVLSLAAAAEPPVPGSVLWDWWEVCRICPVRCGYYPEEIALLAGTCPAVVLLVSYPGTTCHLSCCVQDQPQQVS